MEKLVKLEVFLERTGITRRDAHSMIRRGVIRATKPGESNQSNWYVFEGEIDRILAGGNK